MAPRMRLPTLRSLTTRTTATLQQPRTFTTTAPRRADITTHRKPYGAFRGGLLGFFAGSTLAGAGVYYYILDEYRISNQMLGEDIYSLRAAVQRTEEYVRVLEENVVQMQSGKKN